MPLCTTTTSPVMPICGWALRALGSPWVAQRVCPMPIAPTRGDSAPGSQARQLAGVAAHFDMAVFQHRQAGRIIAAVFQPLQPVQDNRRRVCAANITNDSTHSRDPSVRLILPDYLVSTKYTGICLSLIPYSQFLCQFPPFCRIVGEILDLEGKVRVMAHPEGFR
jgi:hypothetical protein